LEIYILKKARHPNIVRFIAWYEDPKFFYLVTELHGSEWIPTNRTLKKADGDFIRQRPSLDLFECIDAHERFPEKTAKIVFRQIVSAVHYLHSELNVCHRDLKDENVVVDKNFIVKLIDFGAAAFIPSVLCVSIAIPTSVISL
jgi:serine/threonine protein kinase